MPDSNNREDIVCQIGKLIWLYEQSRFLALMSNSERLTELLGEAYNSTGAGAAQFAKTQESLQSKLNNLKTAWTQFTTSILDSDLIKGAVVALTKILNLVNSLTDAFGSLSGIVKVAAISFTLIGGGQMLEKFVSTKLASGLVTAGELFRNGTIDGQKYQEGFEQGRKKGSLFSKQTAQLTNLKESMRVASEQAAAEYQAKVAVYEAADAQYKTAKEIADAEWNAGKAPTDAEIYMGAKSKAMIGLEAAENAREQAQAAIEGTTEGKIKADAELAAIIANEETSLPIKMAEAYKHGLKTGGSFGKGVKDALTVFKASTMFAPFVAVFSTLAIGAVFAAVAYFNSESYKLKKQAKQYQEELEEIQNKKSEYENELSVLEQKKATESLTKQEQKRLEVLEEQTKKLEEQEKLKKRQLFENTTAQNEQNLFLTTYETKRVRGQEVSTPTTVYYDNYEEYIAALQDNIKNAKTEISQLSGSDEDQKRANELKEDIEEWQTLLSGVYQYFYSNLDVLEDDELKDMFVSGHASGVDNETLLGLGAGDAYDQLMALRDAGKLTSTAIENLAKQDNQLKIFLESTGVSARNLALEFNKVDEAAEKVAKISNYKNAATELKSIKTSVSAITDAISGIYKDGYADIEKISTLANSDAFADLPSFGEYLDLISQAGKKDIPQLEEATEKLLGEYIKSEGVINNLNDATKGLYINALTNMGVTNAQDVIEQKLQETKAKTAVLTLSEIELNKLLENSGNQLVNGLKQLADEYGTTSKAIAAYLIQQKLVENNPLSTKESRKQLLALIEVLGATAEELSYFSSLTTSANTARAVQDKQLDSMAYWQGEADKIVAVNGLLTEEQKKTKAFYQQQAENAKNKAAIAQASAEGWEAALAASAQRILERETTPTITTDLTQFNDTTSTSTKEIQKLSELYNAKKKVAALDEKISDLEEARKTLLSYDERLANENAIVDAYRQQKVGLEELIAANETLRAQKEAEGKATTDWSGLYEIDQITKELKLTDTYYKAIKKGTAENKKYSADILNNFKKWAEEYDDIVDFGKEEQNNLDKIKTTLDELWKDYRSNYIDLVNELADYYEQAAQDAIDKQKDIYDELKELDDNYLDELRKNIEARRDARDRENDVEDITKKQKRLAMLMRDTSGRNASEIADLQKEIEDAQQTLIDDDVDRVLDSIEDANDKQQENWDDTIDLLEKQLDADKENGKFIKMAEAKFAEGPAAVREEFAQLFTKEGIYSQAEINSKLDEIDGKMDTAFKYYNDEDPREEIGSTGSGSGGSYTTVKYLDPNGNVQTGYLSKDEKTYKDKDLTERIDKGSIVIDSYGNAWKLNNGESGDPYTLTDEEKKKLGISTTSTTTNTAAQNTTTSTKQATVYNTGGKGLWLKSGASSSSSRIKAYAEGTTVTVLDDSGSEWWKVNCQGQEGYMYTKYLKKKYKKGGLVDFTGPAWVDGTSSNPEAFLSAQDTRNFTELKQILSQFLRADRNVGFDLSDLQGGDCTIYVTVDQIASDYDVDEAVARIKEEIMSGSSYRNINLVNRRR